MGSYNTTCFASLQTIAAEDSCLIFPIRRSSSHNEFELVLEKGRRQRHYGFATDHCHPGALWEPYSHPIIANYHDCGQFNLVDNAVNRGRILNFLTEIRQECVVAFEASEDGDEADSEKPGSEAPEEAFQFERYLVDEAPQLKKELTSYFRTREYNTRSKALFRQMESAFHYVLEAMRQQMVFHRGWDDRAQPFNIAVMHQAAFSSLVRVAEDLSGKRKSDNGCRADFDRALQRTHEHFKVKASARKQSADMQLRKGGYFASQLLKRGESFAPYTNVAATADVTQLYIEEGHDADKLYRACVPHMLPGYVLTAAEHLNLRFVPMAAASQDSSNEIGAAYAAFVQETSAIVTARRKDDAG